MLKWHVAFDGWTVGIVRNLSIRVPWHDRAWDGHVCADPLGNSSCLALKLIAENRKDDIEEKIPNELFDNLAANQMPPCIRASGSFLSSHSYSFESVMSYSTWSKDHKHIQPRAVHIPAWGAVTIPYRWMLKDSGFQIAKELELEADKGREPDSPEWLERTSWIQGFRNQEALLDAFAAPLVEEESLVLFYATRTPLCDDERRVVLGGALLSKKHDLQEYSYDNAPKGALKAMVWERPIQHSMRRAREGVGFVGGFVMPYHEMLKELERRPELNPVDYIAFAPDDSRIQFSYGSEQVSHGAAAAALVGARNALERSSKILTGPWDRYIRWIDERLSKLWKLQGPAPGMGVVLSALHPGFNGTLFAMALADELETNADPWPVIDKTFSGRDLPSGEDEIVVNAIAGKDDETVRYRRWEKVADLPDLIEKALAEEFGCNNEDLVAEFEVSLGATRNAKGYLNFERECSEATANWQILSVNRNAPGGSMYLNRRIKDRLRAKRLRDAIESNKVPPYRDWMRFIKPRGAEQIVYGDKVICVRNHKRQPYIYATKEKGEREFLANGEIGMVVGQMQWPRGKPSFTQIEFAGRDDRNYSFTRSAFSEDGQPYLELAYAITVHKAQGSEFGVVMLILPSYSRLVSREMLYTALTRQKRRIWILHQGPFEKFLALRQYVFSDIAGRYTNLLHTPNLQAPRLVADVPLALKGSQRGFLEERLIHRTRRGEMVSSKNELVIADILYDLEKKGYLKYHVEPPLPFDDGRGRWADFLIEAKGRSWYWEHCGRMDDESYRNRWQRKLKLYTANGYTTYSDKNPEGRLIVTEDGPQKGLDSPALAEMARKLFAS